jgi:hypothetical protein
MLFSRKDMKNDRGGEECLNPFTSSTVLTQRIVTLFLQIFPTRSMEGVQGLSGRLLSLQKIANCFMRLLGYGKQIQAALDVPKQRRRD